MRAAFPVRWCVAVVIPAQNEEDNIERCVHSAIRAHQAGGRRHEIWIVVVADACTDRTAALARRAVGSHGEVIECSPRSPGSARRMGAAAALEHFSAQPRNRLWLANTDADTVVPSNWLDLQLQYAEEGETAVAGIVSLDALPDAPPPVADLFRKLYEIRSDGSHGHVHGANFGVRADAYLDVGGWSHLALAEDHCLWGRLKTAGWRLRSTARSVVLTSARLQGRAGGGFADTLRRQVEAHLG